MPPPVNRRQTRTPRAAQAAASISQSGRWKRPTITAGVARHTAITGSGMPRARAPRRAPARAAGGSTPGVGHSREPAAISMPARRSRCSIDGGTFAGELDDRGQPRVELGELALERLLRCRARPARRGPRRAARRRGGAPPRAGAPPRQRSRSAASASRRSASGRASSRSSASGSDSTGSSPSTARAALRSRGEQLALIPGREPRGLDRRSPAATSARYGVGIDVGRLGELQLLGCARPDALRAAPGRPTGARARGRSPRRSRPSAPRAPRPARGPRARPPRRARPRPRAGGRAPAARRRIALLGELQNLLELRPIHPAPALGAERHARSRAAAEPQAIRSSGASASPAASRKQ